MYIPFTYTLPFGVTVNIEICYLNVKIKNSETTIYHRKLWCTYCQEKVRGKGETVELVSTINKYKYLLPDPLIVATDPQSTSRDGDSSTQRSHSYRLQPPTDTCTHPTQLVFEGKSYVHVS